MKMQQDGKRSGPDGTQGFGKPAEYKKASPVSPNQTEASNKKKIGQQ